MLCGVVAGLLFMLRVFSLPAVHADLWQSARCRTSSGFHACSVCVAAQWCFEMGRLPRLHTSMGHAVVVFRWEGAAIHGSNVVSMVRQGPSEAAGIVYQVHEALEG